MVVDATYVALEENNIVQDVGVQKNEVVEDSDADSKGLKIVLSIRWTMYETIIVRGLTQVF